MKKAGLIILFFIAMLQATPQSQQVNFTLEDRDRIMRTEERVQSLRNEMNTKFGAIDTKFEAIDSKIETLYWGFGILIALMLFLFGYIIWDRRTALNPVQNKTLSLEERMSKIEFVTREHAKINPGFAEILKNAGLL
jgi:hypothetical protein